MRSFFYKIGFKQNIDEQELINKYSKPFYYRELRLTYIEQWVDDICNVINGEYAELCDHPMYLIKSKIQHPHELIAIITNNSSKYNYLNNLGLINRGYCPVTGELLNKKNTVRFTLFGRVVFLSKTGAIVNIKRTSDYSKRRELSNICFTYNKDDI